MELTSHEIAQRLTHVANELLTISAYFEQPEAVFPEWAEQKVAQRICLQCEPERVVPKSERYVRGNCAAHEREARQSMKSHDVTEHELIAQGFLAPEKPGGRTAQKQSGRLAKYIETKQATSRKARQKIKGAVDLEEFAKTEPPKVKDATPSG